MTHPVSSSFQGSGISLTSADQCTHEPTDVAADSLGAAVERAATRYLQANWTGGLKSSGVGLNPPAPRLALDDGGHEHGHANDCQGCRDAIAQGADLTFR